MGGRRFCGLKLGGTGDLCDRCDLCDIMRTCGDAGGVKVTFLWEGHGAPQMTLAAGEDPGLEPVGASDHWQKWSKPLLVD